MSTEINPVGDYYWLSRPSLLGGCWSYGSMAGLFALDPRRLATAQVQFPMMCFLNLSAYTEPEHVGPEPAEAEHMKPAYPAFIPRRWIHLSEHAKKARTRKKWKHAIARKIELHEKRSKGANT